MTDAKPWIASVARRLERWRQRGLGDRWVVAVSAGGDSVGLLRVLHGLAPVAGLRLSVAHLDHGVRGEAARADAAFVAELAQRLGLPFDLGTWSPERTAHFEADARRARYNWLIDVARARGASVVAVGHTREDQAETILHRILRGTGPRGLAGIPRTRRLHAEPRIHLVRPILDISREQVRQFLAEVGQPFREDASNTDLDRTRARIRHDLLPRLEAEYNPRVAEALVRLGELAAASRRAIEANVRLLARSALLWRKPDTLAFKHPYFRSIPAYLRAEVLRYTWRRAGWPEANMSAERWRRVAELVERTTIPPVAIGAGVVVASDGAFFMVMRPDATPVASKPPDPVGQITVRVPGSTPIPWAGGRLIVSTDLGAAGAETIDLDRAELPMTIRVPAAGDRFAPLGMNGRSTPLADFLRGRRVPPERREHTPLLCDRQGIIWVVGHRIADRVKLTAATRRRLVLSWEEA